MYNFDRDYGESGTEPIWTFQCWGDSELVANEIGKGGYLIDKEAIEQKRLQVIANTKESLNIVTLDLDWMFNSEMKNKGKAPPEFVILAYKRGLIDGTKQNFNRDYHIISDLLDRDMLTELGGRYTKGNFAKDGDWLRKNIPDVGEERNNVRVKCLAGALSTDGSNMLPNFVLADSIGIGMRTYGYVHHFGKFRTRKDFMGGGEQVRVTSSDGKIMYVVFRPEIEEGQASTNGRPQSPERGNWFGYVFDTDINPAYSELIERFDSEFEDLFEVAPSISDIRKMKKAIYGMITKKATKRKRMKKDDVLV